MKIVVFGANGQVGWELQRCLQPLGTIVATQREGGATLANQAVDLTQADSIRRLLHAARPDIIINAGAYTAVDQAEKDIATATAVNAHAPAVMAEAARQLDATLIHYSTDYVFDGNSARPYREDDAPAPLSVYGSSKLAGERAIADSGCRHLIFRTTWVYATRGKNFLLTMQRLAAERDVLRVVADQTGAPTWSRLLADATAAIIARGGDRHAAYFGERCGIYHMTCAGSTTWHGFAAAIIADLAARGGKTPRLEAITTADYPLPARRPAYSLLDNSKLRAAFDLQLPDWQAALHLALQG